MKCLGTERMCLLLSRYSCTSHEAHNWLELIPGFVAWSTYICIIAANPPPPPSGQDDSPSQGDLPTLCCCYSFVHQGEERWWSKTSSLFKWYCNEFHSRTSSFHLHIFLCICLLYWNFVPVQVIPELVHSGFQSKWNSRSGIELYSGSMKAENIFGPNWKPHITCSLKQVAHVYLIWHTNCLCKQEHLRLNQWFYHVNAV